MIANVGINDIGSATLEINVARRSRRNSQTTKTASSAPRASASRAASYPSTTASADEVTSTILIPGWAAWNSFIRRRTSRGHGNLTRTNRPVNTEADDFPIVKSSPLPRLGPGPFNGSQIGEPYAPTVTKGETHVSQACNTWNTSDSPNRLLRRPQCHTRPPG